jgi:hypothetical protein
LLDNYHELLGILEQIKESKVGVVNQALNNLRDKVELFLKTYDEEKNGKGKNGLVDLSELIDGKKKFAEDLIKEDLEKGGGSQLGDIVVAIKELEKETTNYRQGISEKTIKETNSSPIENKCVVELKENEEGGLTEEYQTQIEINTN